MIGSIIGDIVGSIYEFSNIRTKDFEFFGRYVEYTDDSILTLATADAILADAYRWRLLCPVCGSLSLSDGRIWKLFPELGHPEDKNRICSGIQQLRQRIGHACRSGGLGIRYEK